MNQRTGTVIPQCNDRNRNARYGNPIGERPVRRDRATFRLAACACYLAVALMARDDLLAQSKLLRYPDIHGDQVVFCYASDLWRVDANGGTAVRLTAHPGIEIFPKFSPDGKRIAFTGQYDGDEQVYWMDSVGGIPQQLTFYPANGPLPDRWGFDNQVYGWTTDGDAILFRSMRNSWGLTDTRLYTVPFTGGLPEPLPMRVSGAGDFSPDGTKIAFSPLVRDFRTWKRYQGGWAQDLFILDLATNVAKRITDHPRTDRDPMWIGDRIYFSSDRNDTLNIYYYDTKSGETHAVTDSTTFDIRWPSKGEEGEIVYEKGGELYILDTKDHRSRKIDITVPTDGLATRPKQLSAADAIEHYSLGPKGKRVLIAARGDIFSVPAEKGPTRNLTNSSGAHDKWPSWSPDGTAIVYLSDADGEEELYLYDVSSAGAAQQLTNGGSAMRYRPTWSPDSKSIAFSDKDGKLYVMDVKSREIVEVAKNSEGSIPDFVWSPDSEFLAFSMGNASNIDTIYIWSVKDRMLHAVTDDLFDCGSPAWDPSGEYLYYLSSREFAPQIGSREWNYVQNRQTGIFALALSKSGKHPFPEESDEVEVTATEHDEADQEKKDEPDDDEPDDDEPDDDEPDDDAGESARNGDGSPLDLLIRFFDEDDEDDENDESSEEEKRSRAKSDTKKPVAVTIDFDGLRERVARVPVEAHNLGGLTAAKGHLLYARSGAFHYGRSPDRPTDLMIYSLKDRKETVFAEDIQGYEVSPDGEKVLIRSGGKFVIRDISPTAAAGKPVSTDRLRVVVHPKEEWNQIFGEVWRRFRDFFYVDNLHGYDWVALREQYEPLLEHVGHRSDLNYVIGEMIAELNVGHAYIAGGDFDRPQRPDVALPGAIFELDRDAGRYRLAKIYRGHNEEAIYRSPLTEIGVAVSEGDYVLAINGEELTSDRNPYDLLRFKSSHPVTFTVNDQPTMTGAREITFKPLTSESNLVYLDMVLTNRDKVLAATKGEVGYLHIPDMGANGIREFEKWYHGQIRKKGLIIDVRSNGGGNVSQMLLERLGRTLLATGMPRNDETTNTYPQTVFHGHLVCLLDEDSASDGDIFPAMFREKGLGPLIGKRSWGGVIGITNRGMLIDGGTVNVPEFGFASKDGQWIIEGEGVYPDMDVENDPQALIEGRDPQLEKGIEVIQRQIRLQPKALPTRPDPPDRSKQPSR